MRVAKRRTAQPQPQQREQQQQQQQQEKRLGVADESTSARRAALRHHVKLRRDAATRSTWLQGLLAPSNDSECHVVESRSLGNERSVGVLGGGRERRGAQEEGDHDALPVRWHGIATVRQVFSTPDLSDSDGDGDGDGGDDDNQPAHRTDRETVPGKPRNAIVALEGAREKEKEKEKVKVKESDKRRRVHGWRAGKHPNNPPPHILHIHAHHAPPRPPSAQPNSNPQALRCAALPSGT
ncbi:hypothetical protein IWX90DRAFT_270251 [Phyllosticta citrichinensis]|uniref:Uncharacterized protein n=1 Tax=Phyllosticta citrichinensis TaxID=1130410 RepID=A0ABR1XMP1_9PEZI